MKAGEKVTEKDVDKATERISKALHNLQAAKRAVERASDELKEAQREKTDLQMALKYNNGILR